MLVQTWTDVIVTSLQGLWAGVVGFLPNILGALIVFIIGLVVAAGLSALVERIFDAVRLDSFLAKLGLAPFFERAGLRLRGARFLGQLVNWFIVIAFLLASTDILGLSAFSQFLSDVLLYIPNVVVAVLIMLAAVALGNFAKRVIVASVLSAKLHAAHFLGTLAWWSVVVFGLLTALEKLQIELPILQTLITGLIAMLALAGGLAFGLGGKEYAAHLLGKFKDSTEGR